MKWSLELQQTKKLVEEKFSAHLCLSSTFKLNNEDLKQNIVFPFMPQNPHSIEEKKQYLSL